MSLKYLTLLIIIFLVILSFLEGCSPTASVFDDHEIALNADAEVTETWITLQTNPLKKNATYFVLRDTLVVFEGKLDKADTLLHDENLEQATTYIYYAYAQQNGEKSKTVTTAITTMDTTSHDFFIEKFEWGAQSSSQFMDVFIVSPNDIWAVGEIHTEDTDKWNEDSTRWITAYNAVHWDGTKWELKWIPFNLCGGPATTIYPMIISTFFFDKDTAEFVGGGSVTTKIGQNFKMDCSMNSQLRGGMRHLWGLNSNNYFISGGKGTLLHYNNNKWQFLNTQTEIDINDIWGAEDGAGGEPYILLPLSYKWDAGEKKLLQLKADNSIIEENWTFQNRRLNSVWFSDKKMIFVSGAGVFARNRLKQWKEYTELPLIFIGRIRGNNINDIFVAADFGILAHFNGKTWKEYTEFGELDIFRGLAFKNDLAVAVGETNSKAVIYMLKRF